MKTIGSLEAQEQFSELLERAANGEQIVITRNNRPLAMLIPAPEAVEPKDSDLEQVVKEMLDYRDRHGPTLGGITIRELIEEGRRF
jgi:prevent-host-death family protein